MNTQKLTEKIKRNPKITGISIVSFLVLLTLIIALIILFSKSSKESHSKNNDKNDGNNDDNNDDKNGDKKEDLLEAEYFKKSILAKIKNNKISLLSEINVFEITENSNKIKKDLVAVIKDGYDRLINIDAERVDLEIWSQGNNVLTQDLLLIGGNLWGFELYQIEVDTETCDSYNEMESVSMIKSYLRKWMPEEILDEEYKYMLSKLF